MPTEANLATELNISASYLSEILRIVTGQNANQHNHNRIIEKANELLISTNLSVSEVPYYLGFENSQ